MAGAGCSAARLGVVTRGVACAAPCARRARAARLDDTMTAVIAAYAARAARGGTGPYVAH